MALSSVDAALAATCVTTAVSTFAALLPELSSIRSSSPQENRAFAANVRYAEVISSAVVISSCFLITVFSGAHAPILIGGVTCISLVVMYEITLSMVPGDS